MKQTDRRMKHKDSNTYRWTNK